MGVRPNWISGLSAMARVAVVMATVAGSLSAWAAADLPDRRRVDND
jgi:Na+/proline symporter